MNTTLRPDAACNNGLYRYHGTLFIFMSYLKWQRLCKTCGVRYAEIDNIGVHACRFHSGPLNRDGPGRWHPEGCWDCCGKSPFPYLSDGRRNPRYASKFVDGCTGMDHSALQTCFTASDSIKEKDWPLELCQQLSPDIMSLREGNMRITHKGLRINELGEFYVERFDRDAAMLRAKHRYDGNEQMTVEIFYEIEIDTKKKEESIVMDKNATVAEFLKRIADGTKKIDDLDPMERLSDLDTNKVYNITS